MTDQSNLIDEISDTTPTNVIPIRGIPKSGRKWKSVESSRFSSLKSDKAFRSSWAKKELIRQELNQLKSKAKEIKDERQRKFDEKKQQRVEREQRRKENERKAEIVQVVKNVHKLKRMKKKMIRKLEKRDTTVVEK
jgi:hypothetical protein